ncbi:MAG: twin-arginine translocase TatA/TatE family subunit [Phycisphaerales bacterium]|nr:twin-arginine translocase TatA/TatE family subunit [Phycisphaerales bacterium]
MPGGTEWIILLVLGLLIFGRRLPEVGRSLGRGIVEFKRGIKGIEDEIEDASSTPALDQSSSSRLASEGGGAAAGTTSQSAVGQPSVGGEGPNPYAPAEPRDQTGN